MAKIKSVKYGAENPGVNKATVKYFIMAAFEEFPKKAMISDTVVTKEPIPMDFVTINITLDSILKQAKNQK